MLSVFTTYFIIVEKSTNIEITQKKILMIKSM